MPLAMRRARNARNAAVSRGRRAGVGMWWVRSEERGEGEEGLEVVVDLWGRGWQARSRRE